MATNKELTVNDLAKWCRQAQTEGHGSKIILISDDDEGNGYHSIFEGFSLVGDLFEGKWAPNLHASFKENEAKEKALILS